jgi:hypothetical protein
MCRGCDGAARFQFTTGSLTYERRCGRHAVLYWLILRRAIQLAAVVGTILFFINQSDVVFNGQVTWLVVAKIVLTYLVPFSVSMYSALAASRGRS